jgi:hypothetical protein
MSVLTVQVVDGRAPDRFSFECSLCGHCGGNYTTREQAQTYADIHREMPHR